MYLFNLDSGIAKFLISEVFMEEIELISLFDNNNQTINNLIINLYLNSFLCIILILVNLINSFNNMSNSSSRQYSNDSNQKYVFNRRNDSY